MRKIPLLYLLAVAWLAGGSGKAGAQINFSMQIIADNDFAVFAGTSNSVAELLYQNNYYWGNQLSNAGSLNFTLLPGETTFYLLGMGGGGQEDVSGTVNGVDITAIPVMVSSDIGPSLTGYESQNHGGSVAAGTFNASLTDVQAAFGSLTWSNATNTINTTDVVILQSPNRIGYNMAPSTAHLYQFRASSAGVPPTPYGWPQITYPQNNGTAQALNTLITGITLAGGAVTNVYYSLNGSAWSAASSPNHWTNWSAPVIVSSGLNHLSVYAVDTNGASIGTNTIQFTWAYQPAITSPPANGNATGPFLNAVGTMTNDASVTNVYYSLNNSAWSPANSVNHWTNWSAPLSLLQGSNTFSAYAVDAYGNISATNTIQFMWTFQPQISSPQANSTVFSSALSAVGTVADDPGVTNVYYSLNNSAWLPAATSDNWNDWSASLTSRPGINTLSAYAVDAYGNVSSTNTIPFTYTPFSWLHPFSGYGSDGANPQGNLVLVGNTFYGTTVNGGDYGEGAIFQVNADGSGYTTLYSFTGGSDGANPYGGLVLAGGILYGNAQYGGEYGCGTVFAINTNGTGFTTLYTFAGGADGLYPYGNLVADGNALYGTAQSGGNYGNGTVFAINMDGSGFNALYSFTGGSDGASPQAGLILANGTLYGTTSSGGNYGGGVVFAINADASNFQVLYNFMGSFDGANPVAGLVLSGSTLYGVAQTGGNGGAGVVFSLATDGSSFNTLYSFSGGNDGADPQASLLLTNHTLFGTTYYGGNYGNGTVFTVKTDGSGFANVFSFTGGNDGANPWSPLVIAGDAVYGSTWWGGASGNGTIFGVPLSSVIATNITYFRNGLTT